jgi:hypothetical protein
VNVKIIRKGGYTDRYGVEHQEHDIVDFPDILALKLIKHRFANPTDAKPAIETAVTIAAFAPPENAALRVEAPLKRGPGRPKK